MSQIPLATPLAGIKVLEFSHTAMGPTAGLVFAEFGADVIKVEPAPKDDHTRGLGGLGRDAADPDHFYLIGKWADSEEHRRIREFVAREIKPEFVQLIGCRPVNPLTLHGQVIGGAAQGLGGAYMEDRMMEIEARR